MNIRDRISVGRSHVDNIASLIRYLGTNLRTDFCAYLQRRLSTFGYIDTEDVFQEALERLFHRLRMDPVLFDELIEDEQRLSGYLYRTGYNIILNHVKRHETRRSVTIVVDEILGESEDSESIEETVIHQETLGEVRSLISELREPYKSVIHLLYIEQRPAREVAEHLGVSLGTLRSYKDRGLRWLRELVQMRDKNTLLGTAFDKQKKKRFEEALSRLPEPYRTVMILRQKQQLSYAEIAWQLKRPLNTVRSQIYRGKLLLAQEQPQQKQQRVACAWDVMEHIDLQLLSQLEEPYQTMVTLHYETGLSYRQIAKKQKVTLNTVKSQIHRGVCQLRALQQQTVHKTIRPEQQCSGRPRIPVKQMHLDHIHCWGLSKHYRTVTELRYMRDVRYSYAMIASQLNIPINTVKSRLRRARNQMKGWPRD